ncbi:histidine phosphatase superfamily clade-1 [Fusarium subglutinans]|uniref:Histidine phosphatase superfamily clade-1 n=1 Tax=Gibberella subglutinans TaxID=42677 RepID=A0A8H5P172_GIBSU|nr:histidine phosphatase superfamily clade-1 [Fusarium subglutinans]KAF5586132.1 histidine phosphatase superfamily clade-1 [Fusarium subglutinans]
MPKVIHLVRHGQAVHNLGEANNVLPDTDLTPLGQEQAGSLISKHPELANVDLIVSSPLRRTLQTTLLAFPAQLERGLHIVALPEVQEVSDMNCDTGSDLSVIKAEFQQQPVDFSVVEPGWEVKEGKWAPAIGSILERARAARQWLSERPESEIVVVTHGCFLHFFTDDWVNSVNPDGTDWANAEVRSYTISHDNSEGPVLCETRESRERRGVEPVPPTREEQLELRQTALNAALEWGLIRP